MSPPLLLLALVFLASPALRGSQAQQPSPFQGQGIDPFAANATQSSVPVFLSVILNKVLAINEVDYKFEAIFTVMFSWEDPRAPELAPGVFYTASATYDKWVNASRACTDALASNSSDVDALCTAAANQAHPPQCTKYCDPSATYYCCDSVWLPDADIQNVLAYSQDRYVQDSIGAFLPYTVLRTVRVHGVFPVIFDFKRFPFDSQELTLAIVSSGSTEHYHLRSSLVARTTPSALLQVNTQSGRTAGSPSTFQTNEVTGWTIKDVGLSCLSDHQASSRTDQSVVVWQNMDPSDPLGSIIHPDSVAATGKSHGGASVSSVCTLSIRVSRICAFYFWTDIFPVVLATVIAFCVFVTSPEAIDVRISTVVTLFLSLVAIQYIIVDQIPKTAYITAFGAMVLASYIVLFCIILESVVAYYVSSLTFFHKSKGSLHLGQRGIPGRQGIPGHNGGLQSHAAQSNDPFTRSMRSINRRGSIRSSRTVDPEEEADGTPPPLAAAAALIQEAGFEDGMPDSSALDEEAHDSSNVSGEEGRRRWCAWWGTMRDSWHRMLRTHYQHLALDPHAGFRIACRLDAIFGPSLFLLYLVSVILIYTV